MPPPPSTDLWRDARRSLGHALRPYVSRLQADWLTRTPDVAHRELDGTLLFADISGFTRLTERLSRRGHIGAEEMSDALDATFGQLLQVADADGADLLKWGGDAVLLLFDGPDHAARACRAAHRMRARLREVGKLQTSAGKAHLRMSQGIHSGRLHLFLAGDPGVHRELLVCGPEVTEVLEMEAIASAGEIALSGATGRLVDVALLGGPAGDRGRLLRRAPDLADRPRMPAQPSHADLSVALPVPIREHLWRGTGWAEHRAVAVGFVAWSGTDDLLRREGPGAVAAALDEVVRNVAAATADHEVTFFETDVNRDGGKVMLIAGAPVSHGHEAERMLRAARVIVDRAGRLPLRVGVNTGHVFAGDFGPDFRRTYSVKGDAINLAARLVARAAPGQVLATRAVPEHSRTAFTLAPLPPFMVKGKARPVQAVDVGAVDDGDVLPGLSATPLVGRGPEMAALTAALDRVRDRVGGVVELLGPAGLGKSRLLAELRSRAATGDDVVVCTVGCDEYESSTPYFAFRQLLRDLLGVSATTAPDDVLARLRDRLGANAPALLPWLPLLGAPLNVSLPDTPETADLEDEHRKRRLERVVGDVLHEVLPTPGVLCVDDAHFLDSSSADLLRHLVDRDPRDPWLVVLARREPDTGALLEGAEVVELGPLGPQDSVQLLRTAAESRPLPPARLEALAARAGGNPLFLESLLDTASVAGAPDAVDAVDAVEQLPATVQDLMTTQIDALAPADRVVLRYASVLGMRFRHDQLPWLTAGKAPRPDAQTYRRLAAYLVADEPGWLRFRHALMRDVAYEGLPYRVRRRLHGRVARVLERVQPDDSPGSLALHFLNAGVFDKAWSYGVTAARRARTDYANQEAAELFGRALAAERRGPRGMVPRDELGTVLVELGDTWFVIGLPDTSVSAYARARRVLAGDPVRAGEVVVKEARVDQRLRRLTTSLGRITRALRALEGVPGERASATRSLLQMRYAISRRTQGRIAEALRWGDLAVREAEDSCDRAVLAEAWMNMHALYLNAGLRPPLPYGEMALLAYRELGDLPAQAHCLNNLGMECFNEDRWTRAEVQYAAAADVYRRIGNADGEANALFNRAEVLVCQGHLEEAGSLLDAALPVARAVSDDELTALVLRERAKAAYCSGDDDLAHRLLADAAGIFAALGEEQERLTTELATAEAALVRGDPGRALAICDRVAAGLQDCGSAQLADLRRLRGHALLGLGDRRAAQAEFEEGVAVAREVGHRYALALNLLGLARSSPDGAGAAHAAEAGELLGGLGVVAVALGVD